MHRKEVQYTFISDKVCKGKLTLGGTSSGERDWHSFGNLDLVKGGYSSQEGYFGSKKSVLLVKSILTS